MGCLSCRGRVKSPAKTATQSIDQNLKKEALRDALNIKLLILGSGESGKSTVLKQIKLLHRIALSAEEVSTIVSSLRRNTVQCMKILVEKAKAFEYVLPEVADIEAIDLDEMSGVASDVAERIALLWGDESIQKTYARRSEFWLLEAAEYFFDNSERFFEASFEPTEDDTIMARVMTIGINKTDISHPPLTVTLVDVGGQRNERRKWIHCFDNVNGILFLCNLAGYNTVLFEDSSVNRMVECLTLFKQTVNNPVFEKTPFYLLFNKKDMFEEKLHTHPITDCECFTKYSGSQTDTSEILAYIEAVFRSQIVVGDPKRLLVFNVAARFKRDIKTCFDDILADVKTRYRTQISTAVKGLQL